MNWCIQSVTQMNWIFPRGTSGLCQSVSSFHQSAGLYNSELLHTMIKWWGCLNMSRQSFTEGIDRGNHNNTGKRSVRIEQGKVIENNVSHQRNGETVCHVYEQDLRFATHLVASFYQPLLWEHISIDYSHSKWSKGVQNITITVLSLVQNEYQSLFNPRWPPSSTTASQPSINSNSAPSGSGARVVISKRAEYEIIHCN